MKSWRLANLAEKLDCRYQGDGDKKLMGVCELIPGEPGHLAFVAQRKYISQLAQTCADAVIVAPEHVHLSPIPALIHDKPQLVFAKAIELLHPPGKPVVGIHSSAMIEEGTTIHPQASIGAFSVIGADSIIAENVRIGSGCHIGTNVKIGSETIIENHVTVCDNAVIGERCHINPGAVIGGDGFGFVNDQGAWRYIPQIGSVILGDDVDVGSSTTIDRGSLGNTIIENGVKIDNQIQIGHNVFVGEHTIMAACVGVSGSTHIGKRCLIGGGAGFAGHLRIVDDVTITGMCMVTRSIFEPGIYSSGLPIQPSGKWRRNVARMKHIDEMFLRIQALEKRLEQYEHHHINSISEGKPEDQ